MQFKVPQNIMMEDRIAGPLTMVQFLICVAGGGIAFFILNLKSIAPANVVGAGLMALLTIIIAVGRFNDQPMYRFFKYIILFITTPRTRVWHKGGHAEVQLVKPKEVKTSDEKGHAVKNISKQDIARLAVVIDSRGKMSTPPKQQGTP